MEWHHAGLLGGLLLLCGCAKIPSGVTVVQGFDLDRYLGTWYEIARLDHSFERGLTRVKATYTLNDDGTVRVLNQGYDPTKKEWRQAVGKAKFVGDKTVGQLKVSFFGPFYGGYNIIELAPDYSYALVCGPKRSYLWILARERQLPAETYSRLVQRAKDLGFPTDDLIVVPQDEPPAGE
jgi:apolipoprotein D and lipocalin family protein